MNTQKEVDVIIEKCGNEFLIDLGIVFSCEEIRCGNYNNIINVSYNYCPKCGSKLKCPNH